MNSCGIQAFSGGAHTYIARPTSDAPNPSSSMAARSYFMTLFRSIHMNAIKPIAPIIGITAAVLAGDAVWLTLRQSYHEQLFAAVQKSPLVVRWIPAVFVYALLVFALYMVAVKSATSWRDAALKGALVGGTMYGFYDFTNWATLKGWTAYMTATDMAWGAVAGALGAVAGYLMM